MGCEDVRVNTLMDCENEIISRERLTHFNLDFSPDACLAMTSEARRWCAQEIITSVCSFVGHGKENEEKSPSGPPQYRRNLAALWKGPIWLSAGRRLADVMIDCRPKQNYLKVPPFSFRRGSVGKVNKAQIVIRRNPSPMAGVSFLKNTAFGNRAVSKSRPYGKLWFRWSCGCYKIS
jgi:hypothetical protein